MDIITKIVEQVNGWKDVPELDFLELGKKEFPEDAFLFEGCTCPAEYEDTYELVASLNKLPEWLIANDWLKRLGRRQKQAGGLGHPPLRGCAERRLMNNGKRSTIWSRQHLR